jgi:uncharacterized protein (TIGR00290 family)
MRAGDAEKFISSWSGGKDSCFACYKALQEGYRITGLVNFISSEFRRVRFHGIEADLIKLQAELSGIPLYQRATGPDTYEAEFKDTVKSLIHNGIKGMVFGDIYLEDHRQWVERVCGELGIRPVEPIWGKGREALIMDFINSGFTAVVVSGQTDLIDKEWIGRPVSRDFLEYMKSKPDLDICGENGEYHTFVTGGPLFHGRIEITGKEVISRDGFWFLDIQDYTVMR